MEIIEKTSAVFSCPKSASSDETDWATNVVKSGCLVLTTSKNNLTLDWDTTSKSEEVSRVGACTDTTACGTRRACVEALGKIENSYTCSSAGCHSEYGCTHSPHDGAIICTHTVLGDPSICNIERCAEAGAWAEDFAST